MIIIFLVGNPYMNFHSPQLLGGGDNPKNQLFCKSGDFLVDMAM